MYGRRSHIYLIQLWSFIFILFLWQPWCPSTITSVIKRTAFVYFVMFKFIYLKSGHYGTKSKAIVSHAWSAVLGLYFTSSGIWQFSIYFEEGRMLESVGIKFNQITLIKSSHKWTQIISMISNSKLGIWICSLPRIYLNSQPNLYGDLTIDHTRLFQPIYKLHTKNTFYI